VTKNGNENNCGTNVRAGPMIKSFFSFKISIIERKFDQIELENFRFFLKTTKQIVIVANNLLKTELPNEKS
jgi:hypothetical protein